MTPGMSPPLTSIPASAAERTWRKLGPVLPVPPARDMASDRGFGLQFLHPQTAICSRDYYYLCFVGEETETHRHGGNLSKASQVWQLCIHKGRILAGFPVPITACRRGEKGISPSTLKYIT